MTGKEKTRLVLIAAALLAVVLLARFAYPRLSASFRESAPAAAAAAVPAESSPSRVSPMTGLCHELSHMRLQRRYRS